LAALLRTLRYDIYTVGARVLEPSGVYTGFSHQAIIALFDGGTKRYMLDCGFGSDGLVEPILLEEDQELEVLPNEIHRLVKLPLPGSTTGHKLWNLQHAIRLKDRELHWVTLYVFDDTIEFMPADYAVMSFHTSTHPRTIFTNAVITVLTLLDESKSRPIGRRILMDRLFKDRIEGTSHELRYCTTEHDRVTGLTEYFNIHLSGEEVAAIHGRKTEII